MRMLIVLVILLIPFQGVAHSNNEFLDTVEQTRQSIVLVQSTKNNVRSGSPLDDYLNNKNPNRNPVSIGTGFVIDGGYIITNNHVIIGSMELKVSFEHIPGSYIATVIGSDPLSDIAVLKADIPKEIKPLKWGDIHDVRPGMDVWAIGHPKGLMYTVSKGVVSHSKRRISNGWQTVIQSDVAINQGNSGGPLMTMEGKVIAINTLILTNSGEYSGISMSIDSQVALWVIKRLIEDGKVDRPKMGTSLEYDENLMRVRISAIEGESAAYKSGAKAGDIIIEADGKDIANIGELYDVLQYKQPNDDFPLTVRRDNQIITLYMVLGLLEVKNPEKLEKSNAID